MLLVAHRLSVNLDLKGLIKIDTVLASPFLFVRLYVFQTRFTSDAVCIMTNNSAHFRHKLDSPILHKRLMTGDGQRATKGCDTHSNFRVATDD